jgi:hypothetical protein
VPLHALREAEGITCFVMGYVQGESLTTRLRRAGLLPEGEARRILADVADALDYAHTRGLVHRDIKPDNILIDDQTGRAMLADFGIAKTLRETHGLTGTGSVIGTPDYMAPEQATGQRTVDGRTDIYSLGVVGYEILSGKKPFVGASTAEVLVKRLHEDPPPLGSVAPHVPEDLVGSVSRCLARDPAGRWPDARSFREALAPTTLDAEQLPEPLDFLDGALPRLLPLAYLFLWLTCWALGAGFTGWRITGLAIIGGALAFRMPALVRAVRFARRRGFNRSQIRGALMRQPSWWWFFWYPRRFRRKGDVWDRLPAVFRTWRALVTIEAALLAAGVLLGFVLFASGEEGNGPFWSLARVLEYPGFHPKHPWDMWLFMLLLRVGVWIVLPFFGLLIFVMPVVLAVCVRFLLRQPREPYEQARISRALMSAPTCDVALWRRPELEEQLLPIAPPRPAEPTTTSELLAGIERAAAGLRGTEPEDLPQLARRLAESVHALDAAIEKMAAEAEAEEASRLRARLAAMPPPEDAEGQQLRELLQRQLQLLDMRLARLDAAQTQRRQADATLREIWRALNTPADGAERQRLLAAMGSRARAAFSDAETYDRLTLS